jgi:hypothetical protein
MDFFASWTFFAIMLLLLVAVIVVGPLAILLILYLNRPRERQDERRR